MAQATTATKMARDMILRARGEVAPIMGACRAEVELVKCELADRQRQHNAIRAEAAHATEYIENEAFELVAKSR